MVLLSIIVGAMLAMHTLVWMGLFTVFEVGSYRGEALRLATAVFCLAGVLYLGRLLRLWETARTALREQGLSLAKAQETARIGSWTWTLQSNEFAWSPKLLDIFGIDTARFDGRLGSVLMLVHPDDRESVMEAFRELPHKIDNFPIEYRVLRPGGEERHVWAEVTVSRTAQGRPVQVIGTIQDVTERVHAEQGLRESETRLRLLNALAARILEGCSTADMIKGLLRELTREFAPLRAFYARLDGKGVVEFVVPAPDYPSRLAESRTLHLEAAPNMLRVLREQKRVAIEDVARYPEMGAVASLFADQEVRALLCATTFYADDEVGLLGLESSKPRPWSDHELATIRELAEYLSGAIRDARAESERQRTEAALRASEERFQTVLRSVNDVIWAMLPDQAHFLYLNDAAERVLGISAQAFYARPELWRSSILPDDLPAYDRNSRELFRRGEAQLEYRVVHPNGEIRWVQTKRVLSMDKEGRALRIAGITTDTTEHRRLEEEMQQARRLESMAAMAAGFAHDLNNLVMSVMSNASVALAELSEEMPIRETLRRVEVDAHRAAQLCGQLLAYSGEGKFVLERLDMNTFIRDMMPLVDVAAPPSVVRRLALTHGLPLVEADRTQLQQAVMNLITNAIEAIDERDGYITVATFAGRAELMVLDGACFGGPLPDGPCACVSVEDTGMGMGEETLSRAFDPFYSTKDPGRGLGLAAVLGIVRAHRGAVFVETDPGRGSKFTLALPGVV